MNKETNFLACFSHQLDLLESEGRYIEMSNNILHMMVKNVDLSPLAGKIIKFLAIPYPPCKKVLYAFLTRYSTNIADLNILATNSLLKDFQDPNPFIRRLVIKTICSIPCLFELAFQLLPQALCDSSSYVRCTAAAACSLVITDSNVKDNQEVIDKLYEMIRDPDPTVVCSSLSALNEILYSDGGVVINSKIIFYLLSRISEFQEWNVTVIYLVMKKYVPKNTDELLRFLNALDDKLLDRNPAIFTNAADLALHYIQQLNKDFSEDIIQQISPQLKLLLSHSSTETLASVLDVIEVFVPKHKAVFVSFYKLFFCRFSDTCIIKVKKLKILTELINSNNVLDIADELLLHCCDITREVSHQAVHSFSTVIRRYPELKTHLNTFISLMDIQYNGLSEDILSALSIIDLNGDSHIKDVVLAAVSKHADKVNNVESKLCLLKFIGRYGREIEDSPYMIERILNDELSFQNEKLMSFLLMITVKLFLIRPEEMQLILGQVLQNFQKSSCLLLKKQASLYYSLLKDIPISKKVFQIDDTCLSTSETN
ncbi:AP-4 complex subunit beta-1-like isoform X2 [Argiope bruennichi]|nr:AP-4 complex subunit beta-1-like isoform X2 [Argiope bruennichi]XP_055942911.1 AP-4 complex subunit beta-1-like isoform X2 [Argiope bruennichi]XP_055942912.1 AP-4 complex subunit beta-1-like isoform X2 [Argiope bruennichi]